LTGPKLSQTLYHCLLDHGDGLALSQFVAEGMTCVITELSMIILKVETLHAVTIFLADAEPTERQFTLDKTDSQIGDSPC
jgi:hypothetical protein